MENLFAKEGSVPNVVLGFLWLIMVIVIHAESVDTQSSKRNNLGPWGSLDILGASGNPFLKKKGISSQRKGVVASP